MTPPQRIYRFADYTFDPETGELAGVAGTTRLQPQPAKVLEALVARAGELVTRDTLKQLVWPNTVVEADQGLNYCIRQIRAALGDEADSGRFIETLPRRGYKVVVPVTLVEGDTSPPPLSSRSRRLRGGSVALLLLVAVAGVAVARRAGTRSSALPLKVAILPLDAPSGDAWMIELNRQIADQLVLRLTADSARFGVIGPVTTRQFVGDTRPHTAIGAQLGVEAVISGGIRPSDSTLFVQAVRSRDGVHAVAWRERVWGRGADSIAASIAAALTRKLDQLAASR